MPPTVHYLFQNTNSPSHKSISSIPRVGSSNQLTRGKKKLTYKRFPSGKLYFCKNYICLYIYIGVNGKTTFGNSLPLNIRRESAKSLMRLRGRRTCGSTLFFGFPDRLKIYAWPGASLHEVILITDFDEFTLLSCGTAPG